MAQEVTELHDVEYKIHRVLLKAYYEDRWQTPMAGATFDLFIDEEKVVADGKLSGYGEKLAPGTYEHIAKAPGDVRFEITAKHKEAQIKQLKQELRGEFEQPFSDLRTAMRPYNEEWNQSPALAFISSTGSGIADGAEYVWDSTKELGSKEFWSGVGDSIGGLWDSIESSGIETLQQIKEAELPSTDDLAQWKEMTIQKIDELQDDAADMGHDTLVLLNNRERIFNVPGMILSGDVNGVEAFISEVLMQIDAETATKLQTQAEWQAIIELVYDREAIGIILTYMNLFYDEVPPNFLAEKSSSLGAIIMLEILIGVILAIFTAGAGTAARLTLVANKVRNVAQTGKNAANSASALKAFSGFLDTFVASLKKLDNTADALTAGRRTKSVNGKTNCTTESSRNQDKAKESACKNVKKKDKVKKGTIEYV